MLKSILKIDGVNELKKEDQLNINGGSDDPCESFHYMCSNADNYSECMNAFFCSDYKHPIILKTKWHEGIFD